MVGNETDSGHFCRRLQAVCRSKACSILRAAGAGLPECRNPALEGKPRPADADTEDQAAAEASTPAGLHDPERGGEVLMARQTHSTPCKVLSVGVVHGEPTQRDNRPEVVDGES